MQPAAGCDECSSVWQHSPASTCRCIPTRPHEMWYTSIHGKPLPEALASQQHGPTLASAQLPLTDVESHMIASWPASKQHMAPPWPQRPGAPAGPSPGAPPPPRPGAHAPLPPGSLPAAPAASPATAPQGEEVRPHQCMQEACGVTACHLQIFWRKVVSLCCCRSEGLVCSSQLALHAAVNVMGVPLARQEATALPRSYAA